MPYGYGFRVVYDLRVQHKINSVQNTHRFCILLHHPLFACVCLGPIMKSFPTLCSLGLAWLAPFAHAYGIDNSCPDHNLIQTAADSAISMAADALTAISPPDGTARDQNVERLLNLLFRGPEPLSQADEGRLIRRIETVFRGVSKFAGNNGMAQPAGTPDAANGVVCSAVQPLSTSS